MSLALNSLPCDKNLHHGADGLSTAPVMSWSAPGPHAWSALSSTTEALCPQPIPTSPQAPKATRISPLSPVLTCLPPLKHCPDKLFTSPVTGVVFYEPVFAPKSNGICRFYRISKIHEEHFLHPKINPALIHSPSLLPHPDQLLAAVHPLSVPGFTVSDISCHWNPLLHSLKCLASFTQRHILKAHLCLSRYQSSVPFSRPSTIPLHRKVTFGLSVQPLMGTGLFPPFVTVTALLYLCTSTRPIGLGSIRERVFLK